MVTEEMISAAMAVIARRRTLGAITRDLIREILEEADAVRPKTDQKQDKFLRRS